MEQQFDSTRVSPSTTSHIGASNHQPEEKEKQTNFLSEILHFSVIALLIVLPIRMFIAQPFIVSGASMETTFSTGQYLIVDQLTYHFEEPTRGEVIVFRYPKDPSKFFIKRIIGIPGDTIEIRGSNVTIKNAAHPDGVTLNETYRLSMSPSNPLTETLGPKEYFVMGDNRDASSDSRMWGVLQRDKIIGRAFLRLFPFNEFGVNPGTYNIDAEITSASSN